MRTQLARLWIDDRKFLFDPEREGVFRGGHWLAITVSQEFRAVMRAN